MIMSGDVCVLVLQAQMTLLDLPLFKAVTPQVHLGYLYVFGQGGGGGGGKGEKERNRRREKGREREREGKVSVIPISV